MRTLALLTDCQRERAQWILDEHSVCVDDMGYVMRSSFFHDVHKRDRRLVHLLFEECRYSIPDE